MTSLLTGPVVLTHSTDIHAALSVLFSGQFCAGPILDDAGLNAVVHNHPSGPFKNNACERTGVTLQFEWSGPISDADYYPYPPRNILIDQHPHRVFVPIGTTQYLRLTGISLQRGTFWSDVVEKPTLSRHIFNLKMWKDWVDSLRPGWLQRQTQKIQNQVDAALRCKPIISIVLPPTNPPYSFLFPDVECGTMMRPAQIMASLP